jgi:hypothetical protein
MVGRRLSILVVLAIGLALSAPREAQAKGHDGPVVAFLVGSLVSSPVMLPALGLTRWIRSDSPPSMGWGIAQALVSAPYLITGVALTGFGGLLIYDNLFHTQESRVSINGITAVGLGLLMTAVSGWLFYAAVRESLEAPDGSGGDAGPALRLVPTLVRDERGSAAWGLLASASF